MIGILVAEHLPLVRRGLVSSLECQAGLKVVADVANGEAVVPAALRYAPEVAVIDLDLPGTDGFTVVLRLREEVPGCRALLLARDPSPRQVRQAFAVHALGFMSLEVGPEQLADGVRRVAAGRRAVDSELAVAALRSAENPLTRRELDVLRLAAQGAGPGEIADRLFLSVGTVRNHLSRIMCKTQARNRLDAVRIADDAGWL
ncbi:two-component system response regulator DesR [Streptosporangium becharense]|uniref:Two-component system response regulator DesR n=1 Tax=Streptosporangium becharense TaxID=1816182 RepID=A0A7W9MIB2_9ACTN|nr:response regulator transcription factor [Streptosporangium becharense]MBB2910914.1 two-component system response regulator DesR [Streptosporangium becharense]MBB5822027.1 two-component system response regulator DesR [Streptosporangium becharense]